MIRRKARYHEENPRLPLEDKDAFIEVTWLYDLLRMVVVPLMAIYSFPLSALLTSRAYQLSMTGADLMKRPLVHGAGLERFTLSNILLVMALFFVFRYLIYLAKALFRVFKLRNMIDETEANPLPLKETDVNLSLPNAIFSLLGWILYLIVAFSILHLPMKAITYITTGLAAGVGFALKDLINNFFYGIQLMAGRIRIGDKISCDGVRGVVKRVSYQTTQVEDEDGSIIAFTNTDLFSKKFRNLNAGRNYELVKVFVSGRYGTDFEKARQAILEALKPLMTKDKMGRDIVDPSFPIDVRFDGPVLPDRRPFRQLRRQQHQPRRRPLHHRRYALHLPCPRQGSHLQRLPRERHRDPLPAAGRVYQADSGEEIAYGFRKIAPRGRGGRRCRLHDRRRYRVVPGERGEGGRCGHAFDAHLQRGTHRGRSRMDPDL